ncbi:hypothetical protein PROH_13025 [Prochlorothrix hollandica PCC 9006 = CALU 1027]|uniref:Uncharacterized protein n=1 Tax=Prochlorothrix hollandica PCC 9006 = CALU 1027 TaxID=317619 RepID=A0A0M2PXW3_PROHO|nr:hypothetical protein PROH_13025 [Prochlorothrix hollandica PCC 9006 = CALU 1027]
MGAGILWVIAPSFAAHTSPLRCTPPTLTCTRINGMHFTLEPSTSGRVLAPVPTLLGTHNRGNHGGIAPTNIGESAQVKWTLSNRLRSVF